MSSAGRAVGRWGWRLFRRDWRQQLLTIGVLTVVVGAAVTGSAMAVNSQFDDSSFFGDGDTVIRIDGTDPATAEAGLAEAQQDIARGTLEIACALARQVLRHEMATQPRALEPVVREALGLLMAYQGN